MFRRDGSTRREDKQIYRREVVARELAHVHIFALRIVTKLGNDFVLAIQNSHFREKVGHNYVAVLIEPKVTGCREIFNEIDMLAVEGEALQPFVGAVGNHEIRFFETVIDSDAVGAIELAGVFAFSAECTNVLARAVVLINVTGPVAVTDIDIAVRCNRQVGWAVFDLVFRVRLGVFRDSQA